MSPPTPITVLSCYKEDAMKLLADLQVESNLELVIRERGKLMDRRKGHNIFLNLGREWLPKVISYSSLPASPSAISPVTKADDRGIRYMGLGIGGTRQYMLGVANAAPLSTHYPGTNNRTDTDPTVQKLERPVRLTSPVSASPVLPPYDAGDVWLGQVQAPPTYPTTTSVMYKRVFTESEISYGPFLTVPLSEIGLFLYSSSVTFINVYNNSCVAYDTFDSLSKTNAFSLEVSWTLRF